MDRKSDADVDSDYIVNMRLLKLTGFYQLFDQRDNRLSELYRAVATVEMASGVFSVSVLMLSSYYYFRDTNELMNHFMLAVAIFFSTFKLYSVSRKSKLIWNCLELTSVRFLRWCRGGGEDDGGRSARARSMTTSVLFLVLWGSVTVAWCLSPFFVHGVYSTIEIDGTVRRYRYNALNYVYPVSERFYNDHFLAFYTIEMVQVVAWGHSTIAYDTFVISACISIGYQLETVAASCRRGGRPVFRRDDDDDDLDGVKRNVQNDVDDLEATSNLKLLIQDHQYLLEKIREMYKLFEPVTFVQLAAQSMLIIFQSYMIFINHFNGLSLVSVPVIKLFLTVTPNIIHLFITCYLFGEINDKKDSINFALYCSDWTSMSIKYKKMLLLTMCMNNAEKLKLKISLRKIVNLEMFASVMHTTYSIISVLAKSYGNTKIT